MKIKRDVILFGLIFSIISYSGLSQVKETEVKDINGIVYLQKTNKPFTGMVKYKNDRAVYKNGLPEGKWITFYSNNKVKSIENWKHGNLNGKYILYNDKGIKTLQSNYKNGKDHGILELYHENGQLHILGDFYNGKAVGIWKYYDETGKYIGIKDYSKITDLN